MQPKNIYILAAREITTDAADQMNSIIKIIDNFGADIPITELNRNNVVLGEKPLIIPVGYAIATSWDLGKPLQKDTVLTVQLDIVNPEGKSLGGPSQEHSVPSGIDKVNINFSLQGFPFTTAGTYKIISKLKDSNKKTLAKGEYSVKANVNVIENS